MTRKKLKLGIVAVVALVIVAVVLYQFVGGKAYSTDMNELHAQFNRDKGKVRLLVILSPT